MTRRRWSARFGCLTRLGYNSRCLTHHSYSGGCSDETNGVVGHADCGRRVVHGGRQLRPGQDSPPPVPAIEQVRDNLYVIKGGDPTDRSTFSGGNVAVFVTEEGVVVVDSKLPGYGQQIIEQIRSVTDQPITTMLHTHTHNDHAGSTPEFPMPIEVITHEKHQGQSDQGDLSSCHQLSNVQGRWRPVPSADDVFGEDVDSGRPERIDLYHFGRAHTNGDTLVVFPSVRAMHSGDMFSLQRPPFIDTDNGGSGLDYPDTLAKTAAGIDGVDTIIPGHSSMLFTWRIWKSTPSFTGLRGHGERSLGGG